MGMSRDEMDKFAASSWGSLGVRMFDYQAKLAHDYNGWNHVWSCTTRIGRSQKGTIYITYPFDELKGVGGVVSAIVAALMRYQKMHDRRDKMIVAVDELPDGRSEQHR